MMKTTGTNLLVTELTNVCKARLFEEKWLIAPSRSVGYQWLDAATRAGANLLNVHVQTLDSMAMSLAADALASSGVELVGGTRSELLVEQAFRQGRVEGSPVYLHALEDSPGLTGALHRTVMDLRRAGLRSADIDDRAFEVAAKGLELKSTLAAFEEALAEKKLVDRADLLRLAMEGIGNNPSSLPERALVLVPDRLVAALGGLDLALWEALPGEQKIVLAEDRPGEGAVFDTDSAVQLFSAVGEVNEVREVLRRTVEGGVPFDDVEIVCTDTETFVPLIYELAARLDIHGEMPVTFASGIPVRYSGPARALLGWTSWVQEGFPQTALVRMIQDGLVRVELPEGVTFTAVRLGQILREVPIGFGAEIYPGALDAGIQDLDTKSEWKRPALVALRSLVAEILPGTEALEDPVAALKAALGFLRSIARLGSKFDGHCRERLINQIDQQVDALEEVGIDAGLDPWVWLNDLARTANAGNLGPRPGCLYVSPLNRGGHSGRAHTFIVGLDDSRFPGAGMQDPLLLDAERRGVSPELMTAEQRLVRRIEDLSALLARLRGRVTLSYCSRSLTDDRDLFPCSAFLDVYRRVSGKRDGDHESLLGWLPPPAGFSPNTPNRALTGSEWWLAHTCGEHTLSRPARIIDAHFPHLRHGRTAAEARRSNRFTEYDGFVPEAGKACNPFVKGAKALSASRLEKLAECPLEYFFTNVLRISTPEDHCPDPATWLDPLSRGSLLHDVFREFMYRLRERDLLPSFKRDEPLLMKVLGQEVESVRMASPPPSDVVFNAEVQELEEAVRIFLREEKRYRKDNIPRYFEVSIGLKSEREGTPLDTPEEADISLPGGRSIRARGRIDRIDEVSGSRGKRFRLWDYKTGSSWKFQQGDKVHWQGRVIQNCLYIELVRERLKTLHPGASIESFGYLFPTLKSHGEPVQWNVADLIGGREKIAQLCELLATGCFPETDNPGDINYADCQSAHGNIEEASEAICEKLLNPENEMLAPFAALRDIKRGGDNGK